MERTVPSTASEEVELYLRTYYSLLRSTAEVQIRTLEEAHIGMKSLLHPGARGESPDVGAFIYSLLRLPPCINQVQLVVLGQSLDVFRRWGYTQIEDWERVAAVARRRRCFFDGEDTLACFIASRTDIDDVIPLLTAYQVEWNKLHGLMRRLPSQSETLDFSMLDEDVEAREALAEALQIHFEDLERLRTIWEGTFVTNLEQIAKAPRRLRVQLLSGSLSEYRRATSQWWENIEEVCPDLTHQPVYFVSSNMHSLANLVSGFALHHQDELIHYLESSESKALLDEWIDIQSRQVASSRENFLYYVLKKYQSTEKGMHLIEEQRRHEEDCGIIRVSSDQSFDVDAQVMALNTLCPDRLDLRLVTDDLSFLDKSDALILNIDYPLGLSAYNILSEVADQVGKVLGVYVMGKAASLNGTVGDVVIPNVVHDEHSRNTYLFANCFCAADIAPFLMYGTVLDNQKAVSVRGTFLQNAHYMDVFYREGYTDIEMEAGPYLSAVYEMYRPKRHPIDEIVNLYELPFDLGILHYVSDTPLSRGKNLGAGSLSYYGMDSSYATSLVILQRILYLERMRIQNQRSPRG